MAVGAGQLEDRKTIEKVLKRSSVGPQMYPLGIWSVQRLYNNAWFYITNDDKDDNSNNNVIINDLC